MKLGKAVYLDISKHPSNPAPGQFILEIYPQLEAGENSVYDTGMLGWMEQVFGDPAAQGFFPGSGRLYSMTDANPPFVAFQIFDHSNPETQARIATEVTDPEQLRQLEATKQKQIALQREFSAPSVPAALMAKLLGKMVAANQTTPQAAAATMQEQFELGAAAARLLVQTATEYQQRNLAAG